MTDHVKQSYVRTKETVMQSTEKSSDRENNPVGYAEDVASSVLTASFMKQGIGYADRQESLIGRKKGKLLFSSAGEETVYQPKETNATSTAFQAKKRHRNRGENFVKKSDH